MLSTVQNQFSEFATRASQKEVALIAIPTTSGTGSEVTSFAVVSDPANDIKYPLVSDSMLPTEAILDADLVKSVPANVTADTVWMYLLTQSKHM